MKFDFPAHVVRQWRLEKRPTATPQDLARLTEVLGVLPESYGAFLVEFGFVVFGNDEASTDCFDYVCESTSTEKHEGDIAFLLSPDRLVLAHENLTQCDDSEDEADPKFPPDYVPIGSDAGQGAILMKRGPGGGSIHYWRWSDWRWGLEDNTEIGFVAPDFATFVQGLRSARKR